MSRSKPTYDEFKSRCDKLQEQVFRHLKVEYELNLARNKLDLDLNRFSAIQKYSQKAILANSLKEFSEITIESIIEAFELECSAVFYFNKTRKILTCDSICGFEEEFCKDCILDKNWISEKKLWNKGNVLIESNISDSTPLGKLGFSQVIISPFYDENENLYGILVGGISLSKKGYYDEITNEMIPSFIVFTQQMSSLLQNFEIKHHLDEKVKERTAELEKKNYQIMEMDQMKSRFFANISHEFRTPLTLILGPVEDLFKSKIEAPKLTRDTLQMIRRNLKRLQRLINQLLDVAKLETGNMKLTVSPGNLPLFCRTLSQSFLSLAESKKIKYECNFPQLKGIWYFDDDKVEKILSNLISNAFKFTPEGGTVKVNLSFPAEMPGKAKLSVSDTGKGISPEQAEKIFDRFYQVSSSDSREAEGTGIGLSLTRDLVELYRGEIQVEGEPGKGSCFTVILPVSKQLFNPEEIVTVSEKESFVGKETMDQEILPEAKHEEILKKPGTDEKERSVILIVEDNRDLRNYISGHLGSDYHLMEAENGKAGLEIALRNIPDLILSDLMMPEMDGMEMCRQLKTDEKTSHIPVIMLTAKADRDSKLEGLTLGADDYLIKPFDAEELKVRVKNLIDQRRILWEKFRKEFFSLEPPEDFKPFDDELMDKLISIFKQHIDDPDFDIESMENEFRMSRAQLFRKINALTGSSPKELLRNIRLRSAARMFSSGHNQITQVMLKVGFNNSSYFTKCFRELYGTTPTKYIKNNVNL